MFNLPRQEEPGNEPISCHQACQGWPFSNGALVSQLPPTGAPAGSLTSKDSRGRALLLTRVRTNFISSAIATSRQAPVVQAQTLLWVIESPNTTKATAQAHWIGKEPSK